MFVQILLFSIYCHSPVALPIKDIFNSCKFLELKFLHCHLDLYSNRLACSFYIILPENLALFVHLPKYWYLHKCTVLEPGFGQACSDEEINWTLTLPSPGLFSQPSVYLLLLAELLLQACLGCLCAVLPDSPVLAALADCSCPGTSFILQMSALTSHLGGTVYLHSLLHTLPFKNGLNRKEMHILFVRHGMLRTT